MTGTHRRGRGRAARCCSDRRTPPAAGRCDDRASRRYLLSGAAGAARRAAGAQPRGVGVHGSERRPGRRRRARSPRPAASASSIDAGAAADRARRARAGSRRTGDDPVAEALTRRRRLRAAVHGPAAAARPARAAARARRRAAHAHRRLHRRERAVVVAARAGGRRAPLPGGFSSLPMIHLTRALVRRWLDALLHIEDTPERTAAAFALGVFFGFSPFLGPAHGRSAIALAFLLNLNRVAVLLGVYSNLPWIIARLLRVRRRCSAPPFTGLGCRPGFATGSPTCSSCRSSRASSGGELARLLTPAALAVHCRLDDRRGRAGRDRVSAGARVRQEPPALTGHHPPTSLPG